MPTGKIICIGDSQTAGSEADANGYRSYRGALQKLAADNGYSIDFVGTQLSTPASGGTDPHHDGYGGARMMNADAPANNIESRIAAIRAAVGAVDIIILLIGWNDVYSATANVDTKYGSLTDTTILSGTWASAKLVMVTLSPEPNKTAAQTGSDYSRYALLNSTIRAAVTASKIVADLAAATTSTTADRDAMVEKLLYDAATFPTVSQDAIGRTLPSRLGGHFVSSFKSIQDWNANWRTNVPERRGMNGGTTQLAPDSSHVGHPYFVNSVNAIVPWLWIFAGQGHASSNTVVEARNMYAQAQRGSTGQWEFFFEGARPGATDANSAIYDGNGTALRGFRDDGITSYYRTSGGANIETWPGDTSPSRGIEQFAGGRNRSLMVDAVSFCVGVQVRLARLDPNGTNDIAQSRYIVACGYDAYAGAPYRYDYWGWPYEAMDGGHDRWQLLTATDWIWIGSIPMDRGSGHYEDPGTPPPHVFNYTGGAYPYNDYPTYSKSAAQIRANPPKLPQYYSGSSSTGGASAWVPGDYWFNPTLGGLDIHWSQQGADRAALIIYDAMLRAGWLAPFASSGGEPVVAAPLPGVGSPASWLDALTSATPAPGVAKWRGLNEAATNAAPVWPTTLVALPPAGIAGPWNATVTASGVPAPTYSIVSGAPAWMTINATTGVLGVSGGGNVSGVEASYSVTIGASNGIGPRVDITLPLSVVAAPPAVSVVTTSLPNAVQSQAYSETLTATGVAPFVWAVTAGTLPAGTTLQGAVISGTPTTIATASFTVQVTDALGRTATRALSITVGAASSLPVITTPTLPAGTVGVAYSQTIAATGTGTITRAVVSGTLPPGLSLAPTGVLSGTPTSAGGYGFTVRATNSFGYVEVTYYLIIAAAGTAPLASPWGQFVRQ